MYFVVQGMINEYTGKQGEKNANLSYASGSHLDLLGRSRIR